MIGILSKIKSFFSSIKKNDPVYNCELYRDKGCAHVDGFLCDYPNCSMNKNYIKLKESKANSMIQILSHKDFDALCKSNNWNDDVIENEKDIALISICSSENCRRYYMEEDAYHFFHKDHVNVLNIDFDDITEDKEYHGYMMKAMTEKDAHRALEYIESHLGKKFIIHCTAGVSRSAAFGVFLEDMYRDYYPKNSIDYATRQRIRPNVHVLRMLKRAFYKKHNMFGL